ncbi:MAG: hypothetical protein C5B48_09375 [Candidatus Rokuibacteriota bacterium]|nr:MAG: hypothetical protein C5B48_09375 [Candidatus Rokubacteria bacterium]
MNVFRVRFDAVRNHAALLAHVMVALMAVVAGATSSLAEDSKPFVDIAIDNAVAKVGERAVIVAKISVRDGLEITNGYRHRIADLSSSDGVKLERGVVLGAVENNTIVFTVGVTPTRAGVHTVHGVFRFSYHLSGELDIRSGRFEATVTATE